MKGKKKPTRHGKWTRLVFIFPLTVKSFFAWCSVGTGTVGRGGGRRRQDGERGSTRLFSCSLRARGSDEAPSRRFRVVLKGERRLGVEIGSLPHPRRSGCVSQLAQQQPFFMYTWVLLKFPTLHLCYVLRALRGALGSGL